MKIIGDCTTTRRTDIHRVYCCVWCVTITATTLHRSFFWAAPRKAVRSWLSFVFETRRTNAPSPRLATSVCLVDCTTHTKRTALPFSLRSVWWACEFSTSQVWCVLKSRRCRQLLVSHTWLREFLHNCETVAVLALMSSIKNSGESACCQGSHWPVVTGWRKVYQRIQTTMNVPHVTAGDREMPCHC